VILYHYHEVIQLTEKERLISELAGLLSDRSADDIKRIIQLVKEYISLVDENRNSPEK
jgi:hypothetical protein